MAFDLTIGTERAQALQDSIQDELQKRNFTPDADPTMAEYITIMLINNKTAEQITAELEDLIGASEYDASFTDWLFAEAANKSAPIPEPVPPPSPSAARTSGEKKDVPAPAARSSPTSRPRPGATPIYNQALNQALPSGSQTGQKRTASARSPSPTGHAHKSRRMDLPTAPRAMHGRDGNRSLLERMGGRAQGGPQRNPRDDVQARIDAVTRQNAMNGGFNNAMAGMGGIPGNDMAAAMGGGMVNPMALQEMMMNQMALMAQMANNMGMLGGQAMSPNGFQQQQQPNPQHNKQFRDNQHNRRGQQGQRNDAGSNQRQSEAPSTPNPIVAPSPVLAAQASTEASTPSGLSPPERPQSPSLCKFGLRCTNALCRYSHASPVATPESGVVLSNEACEAGINCKDKDCVKAHVSPAAVGVSSVTPKVPKSEPSSLKPPCRYGANCTKVASGACPFSHPFVPKAAHAQAQSNVPCKFGTGCTRASCTFQHPPGRVLPGTFHRGLSESSPTVAVRTPNTGSMHGASPHRTVIFNKPTPAGEKKEGQSGEGAPVQAAA